MSEEKNAVPVHPIQTYQGVRRERAVVPQVVTMKAYEVYCELHGKQEALITGGCRGGFSDSELIAFLYARSFPRSEWSARVREAFRGMTL